MPLFPNDDAKDRIRAAVNIVDLIGSYLELRRQGRNFVCLCPWHNDARPSLQVNPDRQTWKCWVCNIGGDIFSFVQQREGVGFREALEMLADRAGIQLTQSPQPKPAPGSANDKNTLYKALAWAEEQFHDCFLRGSEAAAARAYIAERGISDESVRKWRIGFAPDDWQWLINRAAKTPYTPAVLEATGLCLKSEQGGRYYDRFRGRVMFPIRDVALHTIAFGGRVLPAAAAAEEARSGKKPAKYINSPETRLYSKSEHLYGLDIARDKLAKERRHRELIVTEGYTDVIVAHQYGVENMSAVLGTALTDRHLPLISRFADVVYLALDGDEAGQRRMAEIIQLFIFAQLDLRILQLPDELDPCDFILQRGGDAFAQLLPPAIDGIEHKIRLETENIDTVRDTLRAGQALENLLTLVAKAPLPQTSSTESIRLREQQILSRLARLFQLPETQLRARLKELRSRQSPASAAVAAPASITSYRAAELETCECELLEILTQHPALAEKASMEIGVAELASLPAREIYGTFCHLAMHSEQVDFGSVLAALDDPALKSLLVELDERASAKASHATEDGFSQLAAVCRALHNRQQQTERRAQLAALEDGRQDEAQQLSALLQLRAAKRQTLGISEPTDG